MTGDDQPSWVPLPQQWDRADCVLEAMLRAIRRQGSRLKVTALTSTRRRTALTLHLVAEDGRREYVAASYCTVVVAGHALATSADSATRRNFRHLAKRLASGRLRQQSSPHLIVRHEAAAAVELVDADDASAVAMVVERSGRLRLWRAESTAWRYVGSVDLLRVKEAVAARVGLASDGRLGVGLEARVADGMGFAAFEHVFAAPAGAWLAGRCRRTGGRVLVYAALGAPAVVAQRFPADEPAPRFAATRGQLLVLRALSELVAWSPPSTATSIGRCDAPRRADRLVDFAASATVAAILWRTDRGLCLRVHDVARHAELVLTCVAEAVVNGRAPGDWSPRAAAPPAASSSAKLLAMRSKNGDAVANGTTSSRFRLWLAAPARDDASEWAVGVVDSLLGVEWSWRAPRREAAPPAPVVVVPRPTPFADEEPLRRAPRRLGAPSNGHQLRRERKLLNGALAEANALAKRCVYPRRSNSRSRAPVPMPRQRAAALAAALDLPRESLSRPAAFASMLFLCRANPDDPCYGCFELSCHLHLSLEPDVLATFIRGVVERKRTASPAQTTGRRRRRRLPSLSLFDDPAGLRGDDDFSEVGAFSETADSDDNDDRSDEASDFDEEYDDADDDDDRLDVDGVPPREADPVPWPPDAKAAPATPDRAVATIVPLRRINRRSRPSFETRAAAAIPPLASLASDRHRRAALDALRAANHPDLAVQALLAERQTPDALVALGDMRRDALDDPRPRIFSEDACDHPVDLFDEAFAAALQHAMRADDLDTALAILRLRLPHFSWRDLHHLILDLLDDDPHSPSRTLIRTCFLEILDPGPPPGADPALTTSSYEAPSLLLQNSADSYGRARASSTCVVPGSPQFQGSSAAAAARSL
ncbi:hypothetical protein CTAYLR_002712 [Chrysophaeum taylorii]|uniref:Uncharacterized protein n=1 Tax=Chrysophaeum taylorii TaxID=2483200 RepID=A0AAD7XN58_9STRA|nr:hypothetical protein CTAYLR_002712 [Chrysophaeum taylorii]